MNERLERAVGAFIGVLDALVEAPVNSDLPEPVVEEMRLAYEALSPTEQATLAAIWRDARHGSDN